MTLDILYGSLLALKNVNQKQISEFLRHGNIRSTDRYMHLTFESKVNSANLITNELSKAAGQ